jgi:hypothetical protein
LTLSIAKTELEKENAKRTIVSEKDNTLFIFLLKMYSFYKHLLMTHYHQLKQQKHSRRSNFDIYMLNMVNTFVNIYFCVRIIDDIYICLYIIIYHMEGIDSDVK